MIQSFPYQFEPELFTNLHFTLLRNAMQPLILILSQNDERLHVPDTGYPTPTRANLNPVQNTEIISAKPSMCFFKTKREKIVRTSRE